MKFYAISVVILLIAKSLALGGDKIYTNEYAVYIPGGEEEATRLAEKHFFKNKGQIGELENYFLFEHKRLSKRSTRPSVDEHANLAKEIGVEFIEQQHLKKRVKRDLDVVTFADPLWSYQWYLNSNGDTTMNVERAWELGFTGKGVVVSILDDGVERTHPDLINNYDPNASFDVNDGDRDPTPRYDRINTNQHGTRCAGEVAMEAGNNVCGVGIAFNASIGGIRMLDGAITDAVEGTSLTVRRKYIDIYSASWGPEDNGATVDGPGTIAKAAFRSGIKRGRNGLGSIFVWASGNGGSVKDSCSCDGYANSIYTISVSSVNELGNVPWYLEECSSTLATTYSSGGRRDRKITTSDLRGSCSSQFTGTSASAPMAAGICALALEANPELTWRDMQYIIAMTAKQDNLDGQWVTNGAGYHVSHRFGFGLMDAEAMVLLAMDWETLPEQSVCTINGRPEKKTFTGHSTLSLDVQSDGCYDTSNYVRYLEHVQLNVTMNCKSRGDVSLVLVSPSGTRSTLLPFRVHDRKRGSFTEWIFMSTHFWGERSDGTWTLELESRSPSYYRGVLKSWQLILRGTVSLPDDIPTSDRSLSDHQIARREADDYSSYWGSVSSIGSIDDCDDECYDGCYGQGPENCYRCKHFISRINGACVHDCEVGYFQPSQTNRRCRKCHSSCKTCNGHDATNCITCIDSKVLTSDSMCQDQCEDGFYPAWSSKDVNSKICVECPTLCKTCNAANDCSACVDGAFLFGGICKVTCQPGEYLDDLLNACVACHTSCTSCFGPADNHCIACPEDHHFKEGRCLPGSKCDEGYFSITDDGLTTCLPCHSSCKSCTGWEAWQCTSCYEGTWLSFNRCSRYCPSGTYQKDDECKPCTSNCVLCLEDMNDESICIECDINYYLHNDQCVAECPPGYLKDYDECAKCHKNCKVCTGSGVSDCLECNDHENGVEPFFLMDSTCVPFCPSNGYYAIEGEKLCGECHATCKSCNGPESTDCLTCNGGSPSADESCSLSAPCKNEGCADCLTEGDYVICTHCVSGYYLYMDNCTSDCPNGYFSDGDTGYCLPCIPPCSECSSESSCTQCIPDYYLNQENGHCEASCPTGSYHREDGTCDTCSSMCLHCSGPNDCHECDPETFYKGGGCVSDCGYGYTAVAQDCWSCHPSCGNCTGPNEYDCTTCFDPTVTVDNGFCRGRCELGKYWDEDRDSCVYCDSHCLTCSGPARANCLSCDYYYFLTKSQTCEISCPEGSYEDFELNICKDCHQSCKSCVDGSEEDCLDCAEGYYLLLTQKQVCVQRCPEGFYESEDEGFNDCRTCSHNCRDCANSYLQCISCNDGMYLYEDRCIDECPDGFTQQGGRCVPDGCPNHCSKCDEWGDCTECADGYETFFGECVSSTEQDCAPNQYQYYDSNQELQCGDCAQKCTKCFGPDVTDCYECAIGYLLTASGECGSACPPSTWLSSDTSMCLSCHPSCLRCNGESPHDCTECQAGLVLANQQCIKGCPPGQYLSAGGCIMCHESCAFCSGPSSKNCTECSDGKYLTSTKECNATCPNGTFHWHPTGSRDGFECHPCHVSCNTCFNSSADSCSSCRSGLVRQNHTCVEVCDDGFYAHKGICQPCGGDCYTCTDLTTCTSCKHKKKLFGTVCMKECPPHYYADNLGYEVCLDCHHDCGDCSGGTPFECTDCYSGYELDDGICFSRCTPGYYYNKSGGSEPCKTCDEGCQTCYGKGPSKCITCHAHQTLQRINVTHANCTRCCKDDEPAEVGTCCRCNEDGKCPGFLIPQHRRHKNTDSSFHFGTVVFLCMVIVICVLVLFGVLQARSNKQLCWKNQYSRLPTYYDTGSQFVKISSGPEEGELEDDGKDYFSDEDVYGEVTDDEEDIY